MTTYETVMFIFGNILIATGNILHMVISFYNVLIIAAIVISWIRPITSNPTARQVLAVVYNVTEPVFYQVRKRLPQSWLRTGLDFSPFIVILALYFIDWVIAQNLVELGMRLKFQGVVKI